MSDYAVAVSTWLAGDLATRWLSRLSWSPHLPMAVTLELPETPYGDLTILWRFARDLLADGMAGPVGEGDVRVAPGPAPDLLTVTLRSPEGRASIHLDRYQVATLLFLTYRLAPRGRERVNVDAGLAMLLGGGAG